MGTLSAPDARAQVGIPIFAVRQLDLNDDGRPDLTAVDCAFASSYDRILIFDRAGNMGVGSDPLTVADFRDDVWVFDVNVDQTAQLILMFSEEGGRRIADLYDDQDGDGSVSYRARPGFVEVTESPDWRVRVIADTDWFLPDGRINPRLLFQIDGALLRYLEWGEAAPAPEWARREAITDGRVDWEVEIADLEGDGIADYQLQRLRRPSPEDANIFRTTLYVNRRPRPPVSYTEALFWPLLVAKHSDRDYNYFDRPPVVTVDWGQARIDRVGILGYPTEQGYHINSRALWEKGRSNYANFENPMAYYDLAEDADGRPELMVRLEVFAEGDLSFSTEAWFLGGFPWPIVQVDYPWDQDNDGRWDYQVSLAGFHPVTTVVQFPDFSVQTVPYETLPEWVLEREWEIATFVAAERGAYWSSEGMTEWEVNRGFRDGQLVEPSGLRNLYMTGLVDEPPLENYSEIRRGMRGEYAVNGVGRPTLYWSPVDHRLHLFGAQGGLWNVDGVALVRYADRDGDGYLDEWQYSVGDRSVRQLNILYGYLLYGGEGEVIIRRADVPRPSFTAAPPHNHAAWNQLGERIEAHRRPLAPEDLKGMLSQFEGPETRITGAHMRDLRVTRRGFRFVLETTSTERRASDGAGLEGPLSPGLYRVAWQDGHWDVRPLTPAAPHLVSLEMDAVREGEWTTLTAAVRNGGLEDLGPLSLCAILNGPRKAHQVLTATLSLLPGEEEREAHWIWQPPVAGVWRVTLLAGCEGSEASPLILGEALMNVGRRPPLYWYRFLSLPPRARTIVLFLLGGIVTLGGVMAALWLRADPGYPENTGKWHLLLALYALLVAGYVGARFLWNWTSTDDARLTLAAERLYTEGTVVPRADAYPFGYAYPVLNVFLSHWTGLPIRTLQVLVQPFMVVLLVPLAFATFRNLTGSATAGGLAAMFLFLQPEFLFEAVRSSHPKLTWALALGLLYTLSTSFSMAETGKSIGKWVVLSYLFAFGLTTSSAFFASSYLFAIAGAFAGWRLLRRWARRQNERWMPLMRLLYVVLSCSILLYVFIYHIYPPVRSQLSILRSIIDQVALLFLSVDVATNPYRYVRQAWISEQLYLMLTLFNWLVLAISAGFWIARMRKVWRGVGELSPNQLFAWLLYGGFGLLLALSVLLDLAGVLSANLQVRIFPHLMIVAIPLAAEAVTGWFRRAHRASPPARRLAAVLTVLLVSWFSLASLLKVTNEPLLSYVWLFYARAEQRTVDWLALYGESAPVWMGSDERLVALAQASKDWKERRLKARWGEREMDSPYLILSEAVILRAWRAGSALPDLQPYSRIYDDGFATVYWAGRTGPYFR